MNIDGVKKCMLNYTDSHIQEKKNDISFSRKSKGIRRGYLRHIGGDLILRTCCVEDLNFH
jgi:hypothetical protein